MTDTRDVPPTDHNDAAEAEVVRRYTEWDEGAGQMPPLPEPPPPR